MILDPFPGSDSNEAPYVLFAITVAYTGLPHGRLNGAALSTETGTEQFFGPACKYLA